MSRSGAESQGRDSRVEEAVARVIGSAWCRIRSATRGSAGLEGVIRVHSAAE